VKLQLEALWEDCDTDADIKEALDKLPKDLDETYKRCVRRIALKNSNVSSRILRWVCAVSKPFELDQLREVLAINVSTGRLHRDKVPPAREILKCCSNLVTTDDNNQVLLVHHSVRQFLCAGKANDELFAAGFDLANSKLELGQLCVAHLTSADYSRTLQSSSKPRGPEFTINAQAVEILSRNVPSWVQRALPQPKPVHVFLPKKSQPNMKPPSCFQFAKENWAPLTAGINRSSDSWDAFSTLALEPNSSWRLHPWPPQGESLDSHYFGLLGWAIANFHLPLIDLLLGLRRKPRTDIFDLPFHYYEDLPALHLASRLGYLEIVKLLLPFCDINKKDNTGKTALHHAAKSGQSDIIMLLLLERKANIKARDVEKRTALHLAAVNGHVESVQLLLDGGANIKDKDHYGQTALLCAAYGWHEALVELLLDRGADIEDKDRNGLKALTWAVCGGSEAMVELLLDRGANIESIDGIYPQQALSHAAGNGNETVVKLLLDRGANIESKSKVFGQAALSWAARKGEEATVKLLLDRGADIEGKDEYGKTALLWAARKGKEATVKLLLDRGANIESEDRDRRTALSWAAREGKEATVKLLLDRGANIWSADYAGQTPLSRAAKNGDEAVIKLLQQYRIP
jgi:ankyrin repeat protein